VVVLGAGRSQVPLLEAAARRGCATIAVDRDADAPGARLADLLRVGSARDAVAAGAACRALADEGRLAGVVTSSTSAGALRAVAELAERHDLRGCPPAALELLLDKPAQRRVLAERGVPVARGSVCASFEAATCFADTSTGSVVCKPAAESRGGAAVARVEGADRLALRLAWERAASASADGRVLVEEYVDGPELNVAGWVAGGEPHVLCVLEKHTAEPHGYHHRGYATGPDATGGAAARELAVAAARALGLRDTLFGADLRVGAAGPRVLEVGPSLDARVDRLLARLGTDPWELALALAAAAPAEPRRPAGAGALAFLYGGGGRRLTDAAVARVEELAARLGVELEWERAPGDELRRPASVADTVARVLVGGADPAGSWIAADAARRALEGALEDGGTGAEDAA